MPVVIDENHVVHYQIVDPWVGGWKDIDSWLYRDMRVCPKDEFHRYLIRRAGAVWMFISHKGMPTAVFRGARTSWLNWWKYPQMRVDLAKSKNRSRLSQYAGRRRWLTHDMDDWELARSQQPLVDKSDWAELYGADNAR